MQESIEKIRTRTSVSVLSNLIKSAISFLTGILLARWLGVDDYGRMAFLIATFLAFRQLIDIATSSAFFTFLSKKPRSAKFVRYFWYWVCFQFIVSFLLVVLILPESVMQIIWKGESRLLVILALVATFLQHHVWSIVSQMAEASRQTVRLQKLNITIVLFHLCAVILLWAIGKLAIPLIFIAIILEWSLAGWIASRMYKVDSKSGNTQIDTPRSVFMEFWIYCLPFIPYAILSFTHDFLDRWMLQNWGGSSEQAYFAVAQQFSSIALLATSSVLRIFWKEIAEAHNLNNLERVKNLYLKTSRILFFVGAIVAATLIPWSEKVITVFLGESYLAGVTTLMIMFLYPVHQSLGQIGKSLLYATEKVKILVTIALVFMLVIIIISYFMLAPETMAIPGLGLGSKGLAIKMVAMQLITTNIQSYIVARVFGWKYDWLFQVIGLSLLIALSFVTQAAINLIFENLAIQLIAFGFVYLVTLLGVLYFFPWLTGLSRQEVVNYYSLIYRKTLNWIKE